MDLESVGKWISLIGGIIAIVGVVVVAVVVFMGGSDSRGPTSFSSRLPPVEFLYLDGPLILNYLAQLEGGQVGDVHRISKEINEVSSEVSVGDFKGAASTQHENEADSTLTRTESSALGLLLWDLRENHGHSVSVHSVDLSGPGSLDELEEGWLVRFVTKDLLSPGYIRPYVVVRQSATLGALFPHVAGSLEDAERAKLQRRRAKTFVRQVGPDPRIAFAVSPPPAEEGSPRLKVLLPMHYLGLTNERSLLEKDQDQFTGGRLVVIGKVIRVFDSKDEPLCTGSGDECSKRPQYTDYGTQEIWRNPLQNAASNYLIEQVSHSCETRRSQLELKKIEAALTATEKELAGLRREPGRRSELELEKGVRERKLEPISGRECFLAKLKRQTRLYAPGAVILPIAVYK